MIFWNVVLESELHNLVISKKNGSRMNSLFAQDHKIHALVSNFMQMIYFHVIEVHNRRIEQCNAHSLRLWCWCELWLSISSTYGISTGQLQLLEVRVQLHLLASTWWLLTGWTHPPFVLEQWKEMRCCRSLRFEVLLWGTNSNLQFQLFQTWPGVE
jgi:hypothetical protein